MAAFENVNKINEKHTQKRKRMKKLLSEIRSQMEFYFSDANLSKDRFLKQLINVSEDVPLDTFTKFNKLRKLTTDLSVVAKALKRSDMLELSADGASVRRKVPFQEPKDADARTVYVESLPPDVTIEWMQQTFGVCGRVVYVSLPRYKYTRYLKGFAFVEFESAESAQTACKVLNSTRSDSEEQLGKFPRGCKQLLNLQRRLGENDETAASEGTAQVSTLATSVHHSTDAGDSKLTPTKLGKRSRVDNNSISSDEQHQVKRTKSSESNIDEVRVVVDNEALGIMTNVSSATAEGSKSAKKRRSAEPFNTSEEKLQKTEAVINESAKKRDSLPGRSTNSSNGRVATDDRPHLRVISKAEWLQLKEEYVRRQRDNLHRLKEQLKTVKHDADTAEHAGTELVPSKNELTFIPNVIVHVSSTQELDKQTLKKSLSAVAPVAYVDVSPDQVTAHVRCASEDGARAIIASPDLSHLNLTLLQGDEESEYWTKITADRQKKYDKTDKSHAKKNKKQRGKDKLLSKADDMRAKVQHIVFD